VSPFTLEGQMLGKYRVLEALGRGGMAQVYRGYHPTLDRYVAIKVLRVDLVDDENFLKRFRHEAHAVSGLRHANIVQVFDFDVQDDYYFMVMELLEGDTLRARLNDYRLKKQRMPLDEIVRILVDVLSGLAYAHSEGIIHRDIKPANIMLTKKGQAVLTDFGIAQILGSTKVTVSGALMGTLNYMAPEQGLEGRCDARSDIYSLGIVLFEMLTGYTPFDADTPLAILMKHLNDPLPLPSQLDPSLPPSLEQVVLKTLSKAPEDRYQSAAEMAAALQRLEEPLPDEARQMSPASGRLQSTGGVLRRLAPADRGPAPGQGRYRLGHPAGYNGEQSRGFGGALEAADRELALGLDRGPLRPGAVPGLQHVGCDGHFGHQAKRLQHRLGLRDLPGGRLLHPAGLGHQNALAADPGHHPVWERGHPVVLGPDRALAGLGFPVDVRADDRCGCYLAADQLEKNAERAAYRTSASSLLLTVLAVVLAVSTCWLSFIINLFR
jgi:tRNA A-37 threonylcarbamoyl transferase component Bud32